MTDHHPTSIAVLRLGALGDVCLTVPLIRSLQKNAPQADIYWIISQPMYRLVEGLAGVKFIVIDKPQSLKDYWRLYWQLKSYHFDALVVPQATIRSNLLCSMIKANVKYGYGKLHSRDMQRWFVNRTVPAEKEHLLDSFLRFTEPFGKEKICCCDLPISESDRTWAEQQLQVYPGKWLAICPATSKTERNWFSDRYTKVANQLHQRWQVNVVLVGGPSTIEKQIADEIGAGLTMPNLNLVGKSTLKQMSALMGQVDLLISPDTGPLHIAGAMQTPVVGLYAVAPPEKTGPYFSQQWVVNKFPEAVRTILKKDPNKVWWHERVHSQDAMALISVDAVVAKCDAVLQNLIEPQ